MEIVEMDDNKITVRFTSGMEFVVCERWLDRALEFSGWKKETTPCAMELSYRKIPTLSRDAVLDKMQEIKDTLEAK